MFLVIYAAICGSGDGAVAGVPAHRYWRILLNPDNDHPGFYLAVGNIDFSETVGGFVANQHTSYSFTVYGTHFDHAGFTELFSGRTATADWRSYNKTGARVEFDFGEGNTFSMAQVVLTNGSLSSYSPRKIAVEYSDDGVTWTESWRAAPSTTTAYATDVLSDETIIPDLTGDYTKQAMSVARGAIVTAPVTSGTLHIDDSRLLVLHSPRRASETGIECERLYAIIEGA